MIGNSRRTMVALSGAVALAVPPFAASGAVAATARHAAGPDQQTAAAATATTTRVSVTNRGTGANGETYIAAVSADGRYVAFTSDASNLVSGDTNNVPDVFVRDRQAQTLRRIDVSSQGDQAIGGHNEGAGNVVINDSGRYVAYDSASTNLVSGDTNNVRDVFLRDRQLGLTSRVNVSSTGRQANGLSAVQAISATGRYVVFTSDATNLVAGDTNGRTDVFVRDRQTRTTSRISLGAESVQANDTSEGGSISADGRYVAFTSYATNLVSDDTNGKADVFVRDRQAGTTRRVSVSSAGKQANNESVRAQISANGRFVGFDSYASNLVSGDTNADNDAFVRDLQASKTFLISKSSQGVQSDGWSGQVSLSADGRYVAFTSIALNLVPGTAGNGTVFLRDRSTSTTRLISVNASGTPSEDDCYAPAISADGRYVTFLAEEGLVPSDTDSFVDAYLRGPLF